MSLFNWFSSKPKAVKPAAVEEGNAGNAGKAAKAGRGIDSTPVSLAVEPLHTLEERKLRRHARRESLYTAIRESMTRAGVLSTGYKFKVLSLDQTGNEFMVMMDLLPGFDGGFEQLVEMEGLIQRSAQARYGILVPTVYWRRDGVGAAARPSIEVKTGAGANNGNSLDSHTGVGNRGVSSDTNTKINTSAIKPPLPVAAAVAKVPATAAPIAAPVAAAAAGYTPAVQARFAGLLEPLPITPAALKLAPAQPAAAAPGTLQPLNKPASSATAAPDTATANHAAMSVKPASTAPRRALPGRQEIGADEVAAFRQALLAASAKAPLVVAENGVKVRSGPRSYTLLTGFEDTEMPDAHGQPALGKTQYGDLV